MTSESKLPEKHVSTAQFVYRHYTCFSMVTGPKSKVKLIFLIPQQETCYTIKRYNVHKFDLLGQKMCELTFE